jgi:hypothetical protein
MKKTFFGFALGAMLFILSGLGVGLDEIKTIAGQN